jgi:signal transduction histidine kinase
VDVRLRLPGRGAGRDLRVDVVEAELFDTGSGIPPQDIARIFDPFYSTKSGGTGLGLAFTLQVLKEHGGTIRCESDPGRGTTFVVRLPTISEDRAPTRKELAIA